MKNNNTGFDQAIIAEYKAKINLTGKNFLYGDAEENNDEYAQFFFIGNYEGKEVIYDAALYTLRLKYESELYEQAEEKVLKQFPQYKKVLDKESAGKLNAELEEEVGLFMAETILAMEEEELVKVQEEVDVDDDFDFGVGLEASLNVETISARVIENFVNDFNNSTLALDPVLYSFEDGDDEEK